MGFLRGARGDVRGDRGSARRVRVQRGLVRTRKFYRPQQSRRRAGPARRRRADGALPLPQGAAGRFRPGVSARHRPAGAGDLRRSKSWRSMGWKRPSRSSSPDTCSVRPCGSERRRSSAWRSTPLSAPAFHCGSGARFASLAATTLRVIRLIRAIATFAVRSCAIPARRVFDALSFKELGPVLCRIGERAPPVAAG